VQQMAAAMLVPRSSLSHSAAAAAELDHSAEGEDDMTGESPKPTAASTTPASADRESKSAAYPLWVAGGVTAGALVLLAVKLWLQALYPSLTLDDALSVGLLIVAVLPWLAQLLSSAKLPGGWEFIFREIKENQEKQGDMLLNQREQIQALRTAVRGIVSKHEFDKLVGLSKDEPFLCKYSDDMFHELKRLRALNLICHHEGTGLAQMARDYKGKDVHFDLKRYFYILEAGRQYLRIGGDADEEGS
jgi:hypothetical protein